VLATPVRQTSPSAAQDVTPKKMGLNKPSDASTEDPDHISKLGNDGDPSTYWQSKLGDKGLWWRINLEEAVSISEIVITLPAGTAAIYKVEISANGDSGWTQIAENTSGDVSGGPFTHPVKDAPSGRFVRITFTPIPAN
jgi:hypothetical protein